MRIIYLIYEGINSSVLDSQVLSLINFLSSNDVQVQLLSFEPLNRKGGFNQRLEYINNHLCNKVTILRRPPFLGFGSLIIPIRRLASAILRLRGKDIIIIHCRGIIPAYIALKTKQLLTEPNIKVIADIRGIPEELLLFNPLYIKFLNMLRYQLMKKIEKEVYMCADWLCCVSDTLAEYIRSITQRKSSQMTIIPTAVNTHLFRFSREARTKLRKKLGLERSLVLTYAGSMAPWQVPEKIVEVFIEIKKIYPRTALLVLTKDTYTFKKVLKRYPQHDENIIQVSPEYYEVSDYLSAGDIGLLLRKDILVNRVAFPTKYGEYLSNGLFVVTTPGVKAVAAHITANPNYGHVLQYFPDLNINELNKLVGRLFRDKLLDEKVRSERSSTASNWLDIKNQFNKYYDIYCAINKS